MLGEIWEVHEAETNGGVARRYAAGRSKERGHAFSIDKEEMDTLKRITIKRSVLFFTLLIGMISLVLITSCGSLSTTSTSEPGKTPMASFPSYPSQALGIVIDQDGKVLYVEPGSAAEQAGISRDDVLQEVNNFPVNSEREQVRTTIRESTKDQILSVKLKRNGNVVILNVKPSPPAPQPSKATPTPVSAPLDYL